MVRAHYQHLGFNMATLNTFDPVGAFQGARRNALAMQAQEQDLALQPKRNALADLKLQQAKVGAEREQTQFDQGQALQRATILNQSARALKGLDPSHRVTAFQRLAPKLQEFGIDPSQFANSQFTDPELDSAIAETQGFISNPETLTSAQREFASLSEGLSPEDVVRARRIELGLDPRAGSVTGQERIATDPSLTEQVAGSEQTISRGKETGKLEAQKELLPGIRAAIKLAEQQAVKEGEIFTELNAAKAALPGIKQVVSKLKSLADEGTFTLAGQAFNAVAKQLGFSTSGDTARSSMIALVDNQVLPLLRPIFGAAFTKAEGDSLKAALLDPDSTPDSRRAQLDAFLSQMERNIATKESSLTGEVPRGEGQIMVDANGNRARVFSDGTFEEL